MTRVAEAVTTAVPAGDGDGAMGLVQSVVVGKDILELLSTAMYVDPRTLYREYLQNAADGVDDAVGAGLLSPALKGRVDVQIDPVERQICIRDNGIGVSANDSSRILTALGSSSKRGIRARGFRGVGRLAGLGFVST